MVPRNITTSYVLTTKKRHHQHPPDNPTLYSAYMPGQGKPGLPSPSEKHEGFMILTPNKMPAFPDRVTQYTGVAPGTIFGRKGEGKDRSVFVILNSFLDGPQIHVHSNPVRYSKQQLSRALVDNIERVFRPKRGRGRAIPRHTRGQYG